MEMHIEEITPAKAAIYLKLNLNNRTLRRNRINNYADQMRRNQWLETGDPIRFGKSGELIDGQHRLAAIIAADVSIKAIVIRDLDDDVYRVVDSGLNRNPADALGSNTTAANNKAAATRLIYVIDTGGDPRRSEEMSAVTRIDVAEFYSQHVAEMDHANNLGNKMYRSFSGGNKAAWTAFVFISERFNHEATHNFIEGVLTGANLSEGDARLALRNWLANDRQLPSNGHHLGFLIKAFNAWYNHETRAVMVLRDDEEFPTTGAARKRVRT